MNAREKRQALADRIGACYSIDDLANVFGVSTKSIRRWIDAGKFPPPDIKISKRTHRWRAVTVERAMEPRR